MIEFEAVAGNRAPLRLLHFVWTLRLKILVNAPPPCCLEGVGAALSLFRFPQKEGWSAGEAPEGLARPSWQGLTDPAAHLWRRCARPLGDRDPGASPALQPVGPIGGSDPEGSQPVLRPEPPEPPGLRPAS